ncbi:MAG: DUF6066 family protein [Myxococcaceae bacterium]
MHRLLVPLVLLLPALAAAEADPRFARLRDQAEPLSSLNSFLENYIGECGEAFAPPECSANAKAFRSKSAGKKFYMIVGEEQASSILSPGPYDPRGEYTVNIAPLFAAGGYAITHGAPKKVDRNGNPMVMYVQAKGSVPEGWNASRFQRLFSTRGLRVQVVFTPQGVWSLPKKGGGKQHGVKAKVDAIYVTIARTGEPVGLWLADKK